MKVVVIGALGLAGSAYTRVLPAMGHGCIAVTRQNYDALKGTAADVLVIACCNSAKYLAERDPVGEIERTVTPVMRCLNDFPAATAVLLSSGDVYPRQDDPSLTREDAAISVRSLSAYGVFKHMAESLLQNRARQWLILRLGGLLGPGLKKNPVFDLLTGKDLFVHPDSEFGYVHPDDVARITLRLIESGFHDDIFNVAGKGTVSIRQLVDWAGRTPVSGPADARPFRYHINIGKIEKITQMPDTRQTARSFIEWWKANH